MSSKKTIIIASAVICILLLTILFMDYKLRSVEGKNVITDQIHEGETQAAPAQGATNASQTSAVNQTAPAAPAANETSTAAPSSTTAPSSTDIGTLEIVSYPAGAAVYVNEIKVGIAPYKNFSMPVGNYSIKLMKAGLGDYCKKAYVYKNKIEKITGLMSNVTVGCNGSTVGAGADDDDTADEEDEAPADEEEAAAVEGTTILSDPTGADVKINGVTKGKTPLTKQFTSGTNLLKLYKSGYKTYSCFVEVNSNGEITSFDDSSEQGGEHTTSDDDEYTITLEIEE